MEFIIVNKKAKPKSTFLIKKKTVGQGPILALEKHKQSRL